MAQAVRCDTCSKLLSLGSWAVPQLCSSQGTMRFGNFDVHPHSGELRKHGIRIKLQVQPFKVLQILVERAGEVVTREELQKRIWPADTFVDFDQGLNNAVKKLRDALADDVEKPRFIETLSKRGYRFIAPVEQLGNGARPSAGAPPSAARQRWVKGSVAVVVLVIAGLGGFFLRSRKAVRLTDRDTIVLADFANSTGDPVFDRTLRQGLSVQLEQSPFLSMVSEERIHETLRLMNQPLDARLTPELARELCQRTQSTVVLSGAIAQIGAQYSLILRVDSCASGELVASTEARASDKSHVLDALGKAASQIRNKLGESLSTVQKLATPLAQASTPSLEALQAYSLGLQQARRGAPVDAVPFLKRAIELDSNFALAYATLSVLDSDREGDVRAQYATKAYELRNHVSERERLYITTVYFEIVTGELDKTIETLKVCEQTYPRDTWTHLHLGAAYESAGEFAQAAQEYRAAISLNPQRGRTRALGAVLLRLGRFDEAKAIFEEVIARKEDDIDVHLGLYRIAYVQRDASAMRREAEWAAGKADEFRMVWEQGYLALGEGKLERAGELLRQANDLAARRNLKREVTSGTRLLAAYGALVGDCHGVREHVASAEAASSKLVVRLATPLAFCGYTRQAQGLIEDTRAHFPKDTLIQAVRIPVASAAIAIHDRNPEAALESLRSAVPYENGHPGPIYLRGLAYLQANKPAEAAAEFTQIIRRADIFKAEPIQALAHLQLGRAYALQGDTAKARGAYQDFLTLWKDADPDIPILKQAKAEYAQLP